MMIMPPDHTYVHERALLKYYRKLDAVTETALVPYVKGFDPSVSYLGDLTESRALSASNTHSRAASNSAPAWPPGTTTWCG